MSEQVSQESDLHKEYDALYGDADPTKDHPVYWHWLEQRVYALEADNTALRERVEKLEEKNRVAIKIIQLARSVADTPTWVEKLEAHLAAEET